MKCLMFVITVLLIGFKSVYASPMTKIKADGAACYGREYSKDHLAKNPLQKTKLIRVKMFETEDGNKIMDVDLTLKKDVVLEDGSVYETYKDYKSALYCHTVTGNKIECSIDCDGGSASASWTGKKNDDTLTFVNNGFVIYAGCGEDDVENTEWFNNTAKGDDIFKLYALPKEFCAE